MAPTKLHPDRRARAHGTTEAALRELIHALAAPAELPRVASSVAEAALRTTRASGAYIERVVSVADGIEVIAAAGRGTPPIGTRVAYPGSLTDELIGRGVPEALADVAEIERMAPYLAPNCRGCVGVVVPIIGQKELLGSLVLLREPGDPPFREEDIDRAVTVGDATSIAIQRALSLEHEREAREQAARTLEALDEAYATIDSQWRLTFANRQARQMLELLIGPPAERIIGRPIWEAVPQLAGTRFEQEYRGAMMDNIPRHFEEYFPPLLRWFGVSVYPTRERLAIHFRDITTRKRAEEELRRSERRQTILADTARLLETGLERSTTLDRLAHLLVQWLCDWCAIYMLSPDGAVRRVALAGRRKEVEDLVGRTIGELVPEYPASPVVDALETGRAVLIPEVSTTAIEAALAVSPPAFARVLQAHTPRSVMAVPLVARGQKLGVVSLVLTDAKRRFDTEDLSLAQEVSRRAALALDSVSLYEAATRRAQAEAALRRATSAVSAQTRVESVIQEIARNALVALEASAAFVERTTTPGNEEVAPEAVVVATAGEAAPPLGASTPYQGSFAQRVIESRRAERVPDLGNPNYPVPKVLRSTCRGCPGLVVPLVWEEALGALFFIRAPGQPEFTDDEVERAFTFGELAGLAFHKAHLMEVSERQRAEAQAAARARDEMLAVVSHDLRNPLHTIAMSASLVADPDISLDAAQRGEQLEIIRRAAARMNRLIQDLLDVSRIEAGRFSINCQCENPGRIAADACHAFETIAASKRRRLRCAGTDAALPTVSADRDRIVQVLGNYLDNALKFSPPDSEIVLTVEADPGATGVRFSVCDRGPGISPATLPHVFERYWQERSTAYKGAGLGLAIAKGIAEAHRGRVWAESKRGQGSVFYLWLPAARCA